MCRRVSPRGRARCTAPRPMATKEPATPDDQLSGALLRNEPTVEGFKGLALLAVSLSHQKVRTHRARLRSRAGQGHASGAIECVHDQRRRRGRRCGLRWQRRLLPVHIYLRDCAASGRKLAMAWQVCVIGGERALARWHLARGCREGVEFHRPAAKRLGGYQRSAWTHQMRESAWCKRRW